MEVSSYGFDPGLRHGAIVLSRFSLTPGFHEVTDFTVVYQWVKKEPERINAKSSPIEIARFAQMLVKQFQHPASIVGIEWDASSVYWRAQKSQIVTLAYMLGYLSSGLNNYGLPQAYITPSQLKVAFGIDRKEKKDEYMARPIHIQEFKQLKFKKALEKLWMVSDDVFDAFLLSYIAAVFSTRSLP